MDHDLQGAVVGSELVRRTKEAAGAQSMLLVLSAPDAMGFYPKIGMEPVDNSWIIKWAR